MSNASPPIVKVDACARCGKEKEAIHHMPGQKIEIWPSVTIPMVDSVARKAREYTRILCPACVKEQPGTEDLKRMLEAEFAASSKV